jgi:F-type H+-transporting ATPase subunit a
MQVLRCFLGGLLLMGLSLHSLGAVETQPAHENAALSGEKESAENQEGKAKEKFDPGTFIFDHIGNAHEWHIITIGHTHVSIPLPVILISKSKGLDIFMSGKFHHGHETYKGYTLETEGENKGKIVAEDGSLPFDLSITKNVAALFFSIFLLIWIFLTVAKAYKRNPLKPPSGLQAFIEPVIFFMRDEVIKPSIGEKRYEKYMPYLLTLFFFIFVNNLLGLIPIPPGGANLSGNISVTFVLAFFTFVITLVSGNRNYWKDILNTPGVPFWLKIPIPLLPVVEFFGVFTKPFALMVRLFANITAGHVIILGFVSLIYIFAEMSAGLALGVSVISISFNIFLTFIELLVAFLQAFIFTFLTSLYFGMATEEHH